MPKSKSKRRRYQPPPKKKHRPSPRWFGALILVCFGLGVAMIVLNYVNLIPFWHGGTSSAFLFGGLALIAVGFILATQWH
jgi:hypothetical protein